ncbi:MAG TPA: MFS transporter [Candidatus Paceibacterota bacterium]|nr:MFS transporter [Candidatus Paceibacterota bacterium]
MASGNQPQVNFLYKVLVSAFTLSMFAEGVILPIYAIFVQKIGGNILDAGNAMGIFLITQGVFTVIVHRFRWSPRGRVFLMIVGWAIWLGGIAMYLLISNVLMLFVTQIVTAAGNAIADPAFDQELADHTDKNLKEYEWGVWEGSKDLINGFAAIMGAFIAGVFGFRTLILTMILTATLSFIVILWYVNTLRRIKLKDLLTPNP